MMSRILRAAALAVGMAVTALPAWAQTYPSSPVHLIVAYAAGGTGDVVARIVAPKLSIALGQSVIVENRAGASGAIGAHNVATAAPDGLTLLIGQTAEVAINQHWLKGLSYDPDKDLEPIAMLAVVPLALAVPAKAPYSTMDEFMTALRSKKLTFASAGTGTPGHFAGEFLKAKTHGDLTHVPYKGAGPALNDLIGGHVDFYFPGMPAVMPMLKGGMVKVFAVSSAKRCRSRPMCRPLPRAPASRISTLPFGRAFSRRAQRRPQSLRGSTAKSTKCSRTPRSERSSSMPAPMSSRCRLINSALSSTRKAANMRASSRKPASRLTRLARSIGIPVFRQRALLI